MAIAIAVAVAMVKLIDVTVCLSVCYVVRLGLGRLRA